MKVYKDLETGIFKAGLSAGMDEQQALYYAKKAVNREIIREVRKNLEYLLVVMKKGKPIGTISHRRDGDYKKISDGIWSKIVHPDNHEDNPPPMMEQRQKISPVNHDLDYSSWAEWASRGIDNRNNDGKLALAEYKKIIETYYGGSNLKKETSLYQQQAIADYTSDKYKKINEAAKNGNGTREEMSAVNGLEEYIKEVPLPEDMLFYRGIASDVKWEPGQIIGCNGFCSMTTSTNVARHFALQSSAASSPRQVKAKGTFMRIVARKGSAIAPTDGMGTYKDKEAEFIGSKDMKMRVVSYKEEGGRRTYEMEVI